MKRVLRNEFSWSVSRDGLFQECPRKYYFNYYGYWGGWEPGAPERVRRTYELKKLKNRYLWIGEVVHECISRSLTNLSRGIPILPLDQIRAITRDRMRQDFRNSKQGLYRANPAVYTGLFEHEYQIPVRREEWKAAADQVDTCLVHFYESPHFEGFKSLRKEDFLEIERFSSFQLEGTKIQVRLDCAVKVDGATIVWDWKTGTTVPSGFPLQMACYAHYAGLAFSVDSTQVQTRQYQLLTELVHEQAFSRKSFDELFSYIRGSVADMRGLLDDEDANTATESRFTKVEQAGICLKCNFFRVCKPSL
jgi:hypothetical protein